MTPLKPEPGKKYNYGAIIDDLDLGDINGEYNPKQVMI